MSKINETNYPRRTQANYADTDMLVLQAAGGNTYTTRIEDMRDDYEATLAPTIDKINDALAPAENGATASQSYAIGEHFMRDGAFCTAIAAITSGGSFTLNTNYKVDDVANNLEQLNSDIAALSLASFFAKHSVAAGGVYEETLLSCGIYLVAASSNVSNTFVLVTATNSSLRIESLISTPLGFSLSSDGLKLKVTNSSQYGLDFIIAMLGRTY